MSDNFNRISTDSGGEDLTSPEELSLRGDRLAADGLYKEAVDAYRESIERDETNHSTYYKLARAYIQIRKMPEAETTLQKVIDLDPLSTTTYSEIIGLYLSFLLWDKVAEVAEKCITLNVKDANRYLAQSALASSKSENENGIEAAQRSIEIDPSNAVAYYLLGLSYSESDKSNEAIATLEKCVEIDPANTNAISLLAYRYFTVGQYVDSATNYERLVQQNPSDYSRLFMLAIAYAYAKRFEESLKTARSALNYFYPGMYIATLYDRAVETFEHIELKDSDAARKRSACLFASYVCTFAHRYISRMREERPDEPNEPGLYWYEKALQYPEPEGEREPLELKIHYYAGVQYWIGVGNKEWWRPSLSEDDFWRLPQYQEACRAFERSVELYSVRDWGSELLSERIHPFEMLSASYVRTGRLEEATDTLRRGLALISDDSKGWTRDQRLRVIIHSLDHDASMSLSEVYEKLGEYAPAIECLVKPAGLLLSYEKYDEATTLVRRAEAIVEEHPVEESPEFAELRRSLEKAIADSAAQADAQAGDQKHAETNSFVQRSLAALRKILSKRAA